MGCLQDLHPARVYRVPKDDVVTSLVSPLLSRSVFVRRSTGDVSSNVFYLHREALADALEAESDFRMRWLTGNRLAKGDAETLRDPGAFFLPDLPEALRTGPSPGRETSWCRRVLATLLRQGVLEWRVAIPEGKGVYHEKGLLAQDACGHRVLLTGSWNETLAGYQRNVERIDAHTAWEDPERCEEAVEWFDRVWEGEEPGLHVWPVREAVQEDLIVYQDEEPWRPVVRKKPDPGKWTPELLYLALQEKMPWILKDPYVGTLVEPFPHQAHVHERVLSRPPARFLLADEVGLGKTIEAGLILSALVSTGLARRILIIAPAHILRQWDEELREKFRLSTWTLRGKTWIQDFGRKDGKGPRVRASSPLFGRLPGSTPHILLVSQAIAARRDRRQDFERSSWDFLVLDEAHRARGHLEGPLYRKNNLLQTLDSLATRTASLLLLTATPVQLGLNELHDLLDVLGLPPGWSDRETFETFLEGLTEQKPDWRSLIDLALESAEHYRRLYGLPLEDFEADLASGVEFFEDLPEGENPETTFRRLMEIVRGRSVHEMPTLSEKQRRLVRIVLYRMSPLYQLICRNTRNLLRRYAERGVADIQIPTRDLHEPLAVSFSAEEENLYLAVEREYIRPFYREYAKAGLPTHGVGFILTIYRKRAASSWYALRRSLERRQVRLKDALADWGPRSLRQLFGSLSLRDLVSDDASDEDAESELEGGEEVEDPRLKGLDLERLRRIVEREKRIMEDLVGRLTSLEERNVDSKRDALLEHLKKSLPDRRGVIVFSQYKDTVDALSNALYSVFGSSLAKYHGEGGEVREGGEWKLVSKGRVERMVQGGSVRVLAATDAASEGLNLQTMDEVVSFDIPWNPMRIEQRIGRIDRVTQVSPRIRVGVLVPEGTIEMDVYKRCVERLGLFQQSVGPMQPVLVEEFIKRSVLQGEQASMPWEEVEALWNTAREHARLFEEALASQDLRTGWADRQAAEARALTRLLEEIGYRQEDSEFVRGNHRVRLEREGTEDADWLTAVPYDPLFVSLLAEIGPYPSELSREGLEYRVIETAGSTALAVRREDGSLCLVRDLSDIKADHARQVGRTWEGAARTVRHLEEARSRSYEQFRDRQRSARAQEWREEAETAVLRPLLRWADYDLGRVVEEVMNEESVLEVIRRYTRTPQPPSRQEVASILSRFVGSSRTRGRKPRLETIRSRAERLTLGQYTGSSDST